MSPRRATAACIVWLILPVFIPLVASAETVTVEHLRQWRAPDHTRLVFDVSAALEHRLFTLKDPNRIVIDMDNARLRDVLPELDASGPLLAAVRVGAFEGNTLRIVLDLKAEAEPRSFVLPPVGEYGHRLVIDLYDAKAIEEESKKPQEEETKFPAPSKLMTRDLVIAIDAGHGGEDPGAMGRRYRTREKDVTLAIARELAKLVTLTPGMRSVLIRDGDYYVGLGQRFAKARRQRADIFVSIHADAVPGKRAQGSSVYVLSEKGASSAMARYLADKENASDLIGGVSLSDKDDMLAKVLLDLSHNKTMQDSLSLGYDILVELRNVGPVHMSRVAQAGFAVLKSPDIPSVLVETAFISNPSEEKKLRTPAFQQQLARGIFQGMKRYLARTVTTRPLTRETVKVLDPPRGHVVRAGETLASIARQYDVHADVLRFLNDLQGDNPPVGRRLKLPAKGADG